MSTVIEREPTTPSGSGGLVVHLHLILSDRSRYACGRPICDACMPHYTRRMLQALDAYWLHYDGLPASRFPRGRYDAEDWWTRFQKYRALIEKELAP